MEPYFISREEIISGINSYSAQGEPFVFCIDFDGLQGFVMSPDEASDRGIRYSIASFSNVNPHLSPSTSKLQPPTFHLQPISPSIYLTAFEIVQRHLRRGDTYLLNLTFPTPVVTGLSLEELFAISHAPYKIVVPGRFVVFSPESFVTIRGRRIFSCPMKGTIGAEVPGAEAKVLADRKEFFEHNTIVDLIRNDLSMVATGVRVERFRYIDRIRTNRGDLLQVSSEISGELPADFRQHTGEILFRLLPAGSVTGAPKEKTVEIIREAENYSRGFYTGIFGYSDGEELHSAVSIRFIEETPSGQVFKSGGGITALSDREEEYREMVRKVYLPAGSGG